MSDLINQDKVLELFSEIKYQIAPYSGGYKYMSDEQKEQYNTIEDVEKEICNIPTVDAVEVVRCGECIFYGCGPFGKGCRAMFDGRAAVIPKEPTDYCSYGERRESEGALCSWHIIT